MTSAAVGASESTMGTDPTVADVATSASSLPSVSTASKSMVAAMPSMLQSICTDDSAPPAVIMRTLAHRSKPLGVRSAVNSNPFSTGASASELISLRTVMDFMPSIIFCTVSLSPAIA